MVSAVVCSVASRERAIYRIERGWRGSDAGDHGAASPASYRARRGRRCVRGVATVLWVVTAWSGRAWRCRVSSMSVASAADQGWLLRRRWVRVVVESVSNGVAVASGCSTRSQGVQGESEVVARRVAVARSGACPRRDRHDLGSSGRANSG